MQDKSEYIAELKFCLWHREEKGGCAFGGGTKCIQCAAPYILYKLISGKVLHGDMDRLNLEDWKLLVEKS